MSIFEAIYYLHSNSSYLEEQLEEYTLENLLDLKSEVE